MPAISYKSVNSPSLFLELLKADNDQIYGGYFLGLFLFLLFCLDCKVWTDAKINYPFIFEFDNRHNLDWHQLSEVISTMTRP